jgi:hypothetical protein
MLYIKILLFLRATKLKMYSISYSDLASSLCEHNFVYVISIFSLIYAGAHYRKKVLFRCCSMEPIAVNCDQMSSQLARLAKDDRGAKWQQQDPGLCGTLDF